MNIRSKVSNVGTCLKCIGSPGQLPETQPPDQITSCSRRFSRSPAPILSYFMRKNTRRYPELRNVGSDRSMRSLDLPPDGWLWSTGRGSLSALAGWFPAPVPRREFRARLTLRSRRSRVRRHPAFGPPVPGHASLRDAWETTIGSVPT